MPSFPQIALVYLMYHSDRFVDRFVESLTRLTYPLKDLLIVAVDHPHPDYGSTVPALEAALARYRGLGMLFPKVVVVQQKENRGFSAGVNTGMSVALDHGCEYIFLHSHDGFLAPDALRSLVEAMKYDTTIGAAQALMLSYPETDKVNNEGGIVHYLGFGHISGSGKRWSEVSKDVHDIGYASGGAVMLRADLLRRFGLWDEDYFLYHEDIEYSMRLRSVGYRIVVVPAAILYHEYEFGRNPKKWYFMERNRWGLLLTYYKVPTLLLLVPIGLVFECGLLCVAVVQGWWLEKIKAYGYWCNPFCWQIWLVKRKKIQLQRVVNDRYMLTYVATDARTPELKSFTSSFFIISARILSIYFSLIGKIVRW